MTRTSRSGMTGGGTSMTGCGGPGRRCCWSPAATWRRGSSWRRSCRRWWRTGSGWCRCWSRTACGTRSRCWPRCSGRTTRAGTGRWRPAEPREVNGRIVRACRTLLEVAPVAGPPPRPAGPVPAGALPDQVVALAPGPAGPLHGVPALPAGYLERARAGRPARGAARGRTGAVGLTGDVPGLGMYGQGGIGKTVLAAAAAHDPVVRAHFPDGVFWVTAGEAARPGRAAGRPAVPAGRRRRGAAVGRRGGGPAAAGAGRPAGAAGRR